MNKKRFLQELERRLRSLNKSERDDILEFYDERITNGTSNGKSEEEVIDELEPIDVIVKNTLKEFGQEPVTNTSREKNVKDRSMERKRTNSEVGSSTKAAGDRESIA